MSEFLPVFWRAFLLACFLTCVRDFMRMDTEATTKEKLVSLFESTFFGVECLEAWGKWLARLVGAGI